MLAAVNPVMTETIGGSADLTGSNNTKTADLGVFSPEDRKGRYVYYGIREHGMAAAMNGMALHGGVRPYGGTFMCFTDYARPSMRLSALMGLPVVYVMTHDSIGLGEDGPTHLGVGAAAGVLTLVDEALPARVHHDAEGIGVFLKAVAHRQVPELPLVSGMRRHGALRGCQQFGVRCQGIL
mgnify:CR=1 FL=1